MVFFDYELPPSEESVRSIEALYPENPFYTLAYVEARRNLGEIPVAVLLLQGGVVRNGCIAFLSGKRWLRRLSIDSLPDLQEPDTFWEGLMSACRKLGVGDLCVDSFASNLSAIPSFPNEQERRERCEHVLDLREADLPGQFSTNHRRNIRRASREGLSVLRGPDVTSISAHGRCVEASGHRRERRGEQLSEPWGVRFAEALVQAGSAELFQAERRGEILSSLLLLRAKRGVYYQSAGTSPSGMKIGASPFLISEVAIALREEGMIRFNLGGASQEEEGLFRFKSGFGGRIVPLLSTSAWVGPPIWGKARAVIASLRSRAWSQMSAFRGVGRHKR